LWLSIGERVEHLGHLALRVIEVDVLRDQGLGRQLGRKAFALAALLHAPSSGKWVGFHALVLPRERE
jgi:hypothetical protein